MEKYWLSEMDRNSKFQVKIEAYDNHCTNSIQLHLKNINFFLTYKKSLEKIFLCFIANSLILYLALLRSTKKSQYEVFLPEKFNRGIPFMWFFVRRVIIIVNLISRLDGKYIYFREKELFLIYASLHRIVSYLSDKGDYKTQRYQLKLINVWPRK